MLIAYNRLAGWFSLAAVVVAASLGALLPHHAEFYALVTGSLILMALDLGYRLLHHPDRGLSRLVAADTGGAFYGRIPAWALAIPFLGFGLTSP